MGERRKRKSAWDEEDDTKQLSAMSDHSSWAGNDRRSSHGDRHYHEVSAWDPIEEHPMNGSSSFKNTQGGNEFEGGKGYYKNISTGHDGMELHSYNDTRGHGYDQSRSQRYSGRDRSRSRSLSKGRERERRRGWTRSRSRSRNRYDARAKDHNRSRSPINERLSYGWSERRNVRTDCNQVLRHSYSRASGVESRNGFSDNYHEDRKALPCRDFLKGNCRWGDACRYSHHDDDFGQDAGNVSSDKGKNGRPLCMFFAAGKCSRENCRFSHDDGNNDRRGEATNRRARDNVNSSDDPAKNLYPSDRRGDVNNSHSHGKDNLWGSVRDNAKVSHTNDRRGEFTDRHSWDKGNKLDGSDDNRVGEATDATKISDSVYEEIDRRLGNENQDWGMKKRTILGENMGFPEPIADENMAYEQERLMSHGSEFQDHDGISNVGGQNALQENIHPPQMQQHCGVVENNQMSLLGSDVLDKVMEATATHPSPFSGPQNAGSIFPGHSLTSSNTDGGQNILLPNLPNVFCAEPNTEMVNPLNVPTYTQNDQKASQSPPRFCAEPNTEMVNPLNVPTHTQNDQKASQSPPGFFEANPQLLASLLAKKLSDQATKSQSFVNNEHPQTHAEMPSFPDNSGWAPLVNTLTVQPSLGTNNLDLKSMGNGRENAEYANLNLPLGTEHKQSSPSGLDCVNMRPNDVVANSEVTKGNGVISNESKGVEANKHSETQNGHEKVEEGSGVNRDEKGSRLFKNSLVEFVKDILKPTWKEGRMSRDVHKTVVRKVVDKVSSTVNADHIPKTQEKVDQYLACSKLKITKLVQAYLERSLKKDS